MTDTSDCESDAGASPSVSSDESANSSSSRSSSPTMKIVCEVEVQSTPKKRNSTSTTTTTTTPGNSSSSAAAICSTPLSTGRKPRRKQISTGVARSITTTTTTPVRPSTSRGSQSDTNKELTNSRRKRKRRTSQACTSPESHHQSDSKLSPETKRKRNKRRRTRSERNIRAGKAVAVGAANPIINPNNIVAEGEEAVALDAEIDRVLEEKALKNNLSATNVKSIIRHVITNNMVQKMIMSAMKKKAEVTDGGGGGGSSDEDGLVEPKMTRAKTKELLGNKQTPLWPIVDSPVKLKKQLMSETHMLIQHDLPEDSSGDEEYLPVEAESAHYSDDESSSVASMASDTGSPAVPTGVTTRRSLQAEKSPFADPLFKTPPPRPRTTRMKDQSAISLRTRSKLPLNDTPLEDLERQLVAPDITNDMYDWGETDNEDYLAFLKDFLFPGQNNSSEIVDDDDADPEYNVMEDDEDLHDREELRRDRAVKVPKKELNELVAELIEEYHVSSGDDLEDHDLASLTSITPFINDSGVYSDANVVEAIAPPGSIQNNRSINSDNDTSVNTTQTNSVNNSVSVPVNVSAELTEDVPDGSSSGTPAKNVLEQPTTASTATSYVTHTQIVVDDKGVQDCKIEIGTVQRVHVKTESEEEPPSNEILFRECDLKFLQHQMRQHIQLLSQSYVLTVSNEDACLKCIAKTSKTMLVELKNFAKCNGNNSNFNVCNLDPAWNLVNFWPHKFLQQSPIKKKILEEKYIIESGLDEGTKTSHFPRHVVKVIAENPSFIYNNLLPEYYNQRCVDTRCRFTFGEDALIVCALEEFKSSKKSVSQMAQMISELLLVVHPQPQIYHRIRNLRKSGKSNQYCDEAIKKYFTEGVLPEPDRTIPDITENDLQPLLHRARIGLSSHWLSLLQLIEDSSAYKWEEQLNKDPVTKSLSKKWNKLNKNKKKSETNSQDQDGSSTPPLETIDRVFPNGMSQIVKPPDSNLEAVPLYNANGKPGAVIYIPKYALNPAVQTPSRHVFEPKEGEEARQEPGSPGQEQHSANSNIVGLNHLIRKSRTTPLKQRANNQLNTQSFVPRNMQNNKVTSSPSPSTKPTPLQVITAYHVTTSSTLPIQNVVAVGKPFDLPELASKSSPGRRIIDFATLQTPLKRVVFQNIAEQSASVPARDRSINSEMNFEDDNSCNVIEEGTEVELTEDESDEEIDLKCDQPEPEVISLSSEDEDVKPVPMDGGDGKCSKSDSSPKKTESNNSGNTNNNKSSHTSNATCSSTSSRRAPMRPGRGGDDSDEDNDRRHRKRSLPLPRDAKDDNKGEDNSSTEKEKHGQIKRHNVPGLNKGDPQVLGPPKPTTSAPQQSSTKSQKKVRRSPGNQANRRVSKYNVTPAEKMIEDDSNDFDEVADAYMDSYLAKVQSATEGKNPGLYTAFVQTLIDAGEKPINQAEIHAKVKLLFKDYPELLQEFESFLDPVVNTTDQEDTLDRVRPSAHDETITHIKFVQQLEKFTENCPHLKAKIMNKVKALKENSQLSERDIVIALEPFFIGNPVMMDSFKVLFPTIYRPQSVSSNMDFEEIDLDMEDHPRDNNEMDFEIVKLPDETAVPATSTCPCNCHANISDTAFVTKSKHCRKCSLKFQDGKIFIHNGKVMRPVSVELTPAVPKNVPGSSVIRPCNAPNHDRLKKDASASTHHARSKEFKEPDISAKSSNLGDKRIHSVQQPSQPTTHRPSQLNNKESVPDEDVREDGGKIKPEEPVQVQTKPNATDESPKSQKLPPNASSKQGHGHTKQNVSIEWTEEEDTIILTTCQQEPSMEKAWKQMDKLIPQRTLEQIKGRCAELIALIQNANEEGS